MVSNRAVFTKGRGVRSEEAWLEARGSRLEARYGELVNRGELGSGPFIKTFRKMMSHGGAFP